MPLSNDAPNFSPSPASACAVADSVRFTLTGSIFSVIEVNVWNTVLNSVVTAVASITVEGVIGCGAGFFGEVSATYLLPNTVLAFTSAATLAGIMLTYFGVTSSTTSAAGLPRSVISEIPATRPISTPL